MSKVAPIELSEYVPIRLPANRLSQELGLTLWRAYGSQIAVEFPSPKTDGMWDLTAQGYVGHIPLARDLYLVLQPSIEVTNILAMWEYAYRLKSFQFLHGLVGCDSLDAFYSQLARVLAEQVLARGRRGFYRTYLPEEERLPYVRGRLDMQQVARTPWGVRLQCQYEEHTADVEENQILAWALWRITRSGMCSERVLPSVRRAYLALRGFATLHAYGPEVCVGRLYDRLNADYQPLHALSRFFLEHSGPTHQVGDRTMLPFLVNMPRLYELFVAEWLKAHLPGDLLLVTKEKVDIGQGNQLHFELDLVLYDAATGSPLCVLDTKYKAADGPAPSDLAQIVAYAEAKECYEAVLVYPKLLAVPLNARVGDIHVRSLTFALDGDLEGAGIAFLEGLLNGKNLDSER